MAEKVTLYDIYSNSAVREFGDFLSLALFFNDDFASLTELEHAVEPPVFADTVKRLLLRNRKEIARKPKDESLDELMKLADQHGPKLVGIAVISHALTWKEK